MDLLIDTDIGDDVDDAFALALAARLPGAQLVGVTTVAGPVERRAQLAGLILTAAGLPNVPIATGSATMSDGRPGPAKFSHAPLLAAKHVGQWRAPQVPVATRLSPAVELILERSRSQSSLTIVAIGPLTNVALALRADPSLAGRVRLVAMAGKLGVPYPDWNIRCDPAAARAVLASGLAITMIGMQLTMRCKLRPQQLRRIFATADPLLELLARCVLAWRTRRRRMPILHDLQAVGAAIDPALVRLEPRRVRVGAAGFSLASRRGPPNAMVGVALNSDRFHTMIDRDLIGGNTVRSARNWHERLVEQIA